MGKINLAITGCMGRMGQQLIKSVVKDKSTKLVALTENRFISKKINGIKPELDFQEKVRLDQEAVVVVIYIYSLMFILMIYLKDLMKTYFSSVQSQ